MPVLFPALTRWANEMSPLRGSGSPPTNSTSALLQSDDRHPPIRHPRERDPVLLGGFFRLARFEQQLGVELVSGLEDVGGT